MLSPSPVTVVIRGLCRSKSGNGRVRKEISEDVAHRPFQGQALSKGKERPNGRDGLGHETVLQARKGKGRNSSLLGKGPGKSSRKKEVLLLRVSEKRTWRGLKVKRGELGLENHNRRKEGPDRGGLDRTRKNSGRWPLLGDEKRRRTRRQPEANHNAHGKGSPTVPAAKRYDVT